MTPEADERDRAWRSVGATLFVSGLILSLLVVLGADLLWAVALGDELRASGRVPGGVSFAAAPSEGWPPVLVLAELVLSLVHEAGLAGVLAMHYFLVLGTLALTALGARRRGATDLAAGLVVGVVLVGAIATFALLRLQTFSLVPFAIVILLVRSQHRRPDRAVWWAPALVAVWGNLHGSVLLGVCVIGAYLLCSRLRLRPVDTLVVGATTVGALFLNPAGWRTADYYLGVAQNEAAVQREGLWAAPTLTDPFDVLMLCAAVVLVGGALRRRLPVWEYVALAGLTIATVGAARNGVWLLLFLAAPAAYGFSRIREHPQRQLGLPPVRPLLILGAGLTLCAGLLVVRSGEITDAEDALAGRVRDAAPGLVVLAPEPEVEGLAARGVRVWLANPLDAFDPEDQRAYLDFLSGRPGMAKAVAGSDAVLVRQGAPAADRMAKDPDFDVTDVKDGWLLYVRR